ncbi:GcrA family cell cycle regulator [Sphingopyxis sp. Geo48]|nr:GcrA family cell cycle regulator [Sphingopyxis sp. Geo48]
MTCIKWTDEELAALREMRDRGLSFTQISRKLGHRSRNAVASVLFRGRA